MVYFRMRWNSLSSVAVVRKQESPEFYYFHLQFSLLKGRMLKNPICASGCQFLKVLSNAFSKFRGKQKKIVNKRKNYTHESVRLPP